LRTHMARAERGAGTDHHGVRDRIRAERVERLTRRDADPPPLAGREAPDAVVTAEHRSRPVDDRAREALDAAPLEERAVVPSGEEARLLTLGAARDSQPGSGRLGAHLRFRRAAERERHVLEEARLD